jgi:hypothetical protein
VLSNSRISRSDEVNRSIAAHTVWVFVVGKEALWPSYRLFNFFGRIKIRHFSKINSIFTLKMENGWFGIMDKMESVEGNVACRLNDHLPRMSDMLITTAMLVLSPTR